MSHVAPERWADACAERVPARQLDRMNAHAASCERCRLARTRVMAARAAMTSIAEAPAPELPWDSIRAKLRWELSPAGDTARLRLHELAHHRKRRWVWGGLAVASVACASIAAHLSLRAIGARDGSGSAKAPSSGSRTAAPQLAHQVPLAHPAAELAAQPLIGLVTRARGAVQIDGESTHLFERTVGAGAVLASGAGWLDVQLGEGSALALGPRSSLRVERLDTARIELSIDGVVDLEVAPRAAGQRFLVRAGAQTVEVHGTQFRVEHRADQTKVSCRHGLVTVSEGARSRQVGAGEMVAVHTGQPMPPPVALDAQGQLELAEATPYRVPWDDASSVRTTTARLELVDADGRKLRLDGIELGAGSTEVRVARGRHLVETSQDGGAFRRAGWAVVGAKAPVVRFEVGSEEASLTPGASYQRLRELRAGLVPSRLSRCVRSLAKQGVSGTFVRVELAVEHDGAIGYLNILDTDLPASLAECVRSVVSEVRFVAGPAATVVERIEL
jgi:FecR protein